MNSIGFISLLSKYINDGFLTRPDRLISIANYRILFNKNANKVLNRFKLLSDMKGHESKTLHIDFYSGNNSCVKQMMLFLNKELINDLTGAYVHGSLGTYDENGYSDFDALVIIKDEVFSDKKRIIKVAKKLNDAKKYMFNYDPLQHHGWFVLSEKNLKNYPVTYFPPELFTFAKSLFENQGRTLSFSYTKSTINYSLPFYNLCNELLRTLNNQKNIKTLYQLKSVLSEFMLLPAFYVQARDKKGIYKKYSFDEARKDFSAEEWKIMDDISIIRQNWNYSFSSLRLALMKSTPALAKTSKKIFSPGIEKNLQAKLDNELYLQMINLCKKMQSKINSAI